jgi:hypothetical protein
MNWWLWGGEACCDTLDAPCIWGGDHACCTRPLPDRQGAVHTCCRGAGVGERDDGLLFAEKESSLSPVAVLSGRTDACQEEEGQDVDEG